MRESILFYDPSAFTAYQDCACHHSRIIDDVSFERSEVSDDKITMTVTNRPNVCSICKTPYRIMMDTRKVRMITNIGANEK